MITVVDARKLGIGFLLILILVFGIGKLYTLGHNKQNNDSIQVAGKSVNAAGKDLASDIKRETGIEKKEDFFAEYRLERENLRSRQIEMLEKVINNEKTEKKARDAASLRIVEITREMEKEVKLENLVKSKGFADCVVVLQSGGVSVVVEGDHLTEKEENEIRKLVKGVTGEDSKISIILKESAGK